MKKIKVMSVFGTRPDAIKMCPLVKALEKDDRTESIVCLTAQHREMLDQVLPCFDVKADYDLNIMRKQQSLYTITADILTGIESVLKEAQPDIVLVHGDTSTCFTAALSAFYAKIPVGHVEAGLRSFDKYSPYPEEMNRVLVGKIATLHFAPTERNRDNLIREGITEGISVTGNTVIDSMKYTVRDDYAYKNEVLAKLDFSANPYVLLTAHRRENIGKPLENICQAVLDLVSRYPELRFVYPVHLNPAVREIVYRMLGGNDHIYLIEPTEVTDNHNLMSKCRFVMTDSGGIQEEATAVGVPTLVLRTETERPEAVETGILKLVGVETNDIFSAACELMDDPTVYERMAKSRNPYGDGFASEKIVDAICDYFA